MEENDSLFECKLVFLMIISCFQVSDNLHAI